MNELFEQHAEVSQLLFEEGENASDETKVLSLIIIIIIIIMNKTFEQTCKWMSQQFESPELDCSSPQEMKESMLKIRVNLLSQDLRKVMADFSSTRGVSHTDCHKWIECHLQQESDRQLLAHLC